MIGVEEFHILTDMAAILATVVMLNMTEPHMAQTTGPTDAQRVAAMLDDAQTNGYDISTWTADDIVADLMAYADLNETDTAEALKPHVIAWKLARGYNDVTG